MRDVSGVKSSIVKNKGEGEGTATPFISAKNATASWGRRPRVRQQMYSLQQAVVRMRAWLLWTTILTATLGPGKNGAGETTLACPFGPDCAT